MKTFKYGGLVNMSLFIDAETREEADAQMKLFSEQGWKDNAEASPVPYG